MDERTEILATVVESLGYRALSTAHAFSAATPLAPTLAVKKALVEYVWEELRRFEASSDLYLEVRPGADLHAVVKPRLDEIPRPASWLEVAVIQFVFDRAGHLQLEEIRAAREPRVARLAARILEGERMHSRIGDEGGNAVRNLCAGDRDALGRAQAYFERWLAISLRSFGRPGTARGARAMELGLKRRDSAEVVKEYLADLAPTVQRIGLSLPTRAQLGLDLPDGLGLV
jgi:1,2-phenylacetyl-CoA epoxidase catalytic subunit